MRTPRPSTEAARPGAVHPLGTIKTGTGLCCTTLLLTLPRIWDPALDGAWLALPMAEVLAIGVTIFFLRKMGRKYHYLA